MNDLAGLRVLITRPEGRANGLLRAIADAGGSARHVPLLAIEPLDAQRDAPQWRDSARKFQQLAQYRRVIAISVNAVHYGLQRLTAEHAGALPAAIGWYGIGAATAAEFARWNIVAQGGGDGATTEALLALPDLQNVRGETILILRGVGGRETLAAALRARGATVDYAECYRRCAPRLDAAQVALLCSGAFDAVCVNSAETLQNLHDSVTAGAANAWSVYRNVALLVPSERVAQLARRLGCERIVVAANAGTEATLDSLRALRRAS